MRKIFIAIVILLALALIIFSISELENIVNTLHHSDWRFLVVALFFECIWLYNMATTFSVLFRLVGMKEDRKRLLLLSTAANFINVVAPSGGIGGIAVFLDDARRRNYSTGRVTLVGVLWVLFDYAGLLCLLALSWVVLIRRNNLTAGEITASLLMLGLAVLIGVLFYVGYRSTTTLGNVLAWGVRQINRLLRPFIHREYMAEAKGHAFAAEMADGINAIRGRLKHLVWPFLFSLNNKALLICVMAFCFLALGVPFSVGTLVGGVSIGYLFLIISPTPSGIGVVEGILPVALASLRVQWEAAVLITLVYRGLTFWFPLAVGGVAFRWLQKNPKTDSKISQSA
jgi:uncharacterized protein (TIRG00374 family)